MSFFRCIMDAKHYEAATRFKVNPESCGNPEHYEEYIMYNALSDNKLGMGTTYIFCDGDIDSDYEIMGYVTVKASSFVKNYGDDILGFPAIEIAELAVAKKYERRGVGRDMVDFVISMARDLNDQYLGVQYLLLCADPKSVGFYKKSNLTEISSTYEVIPRESWNTNCVPMYIKLVC